MILPRFSTRTLFAIVAACGVVFALAAWGLDGAAWAAAIAIAALALAVTLCLHAVVFLALQPLNRLALRALRTATDESQAAIVPEMVDQIPPDQNDSDQKDSPLGDSKPEDPEPNAAVSKSNAAEPNTTQNDDSPPR